MKRQSQSEMISEKILDLISRGYEDKKVIYDKIVEEDKIPRPTVRRVAMNLRDKLKFATGILEKDATKGKKGRPKKIKEEKPRI
jgi:hypothetical protein